MGNANTGPTLTQLQETLEKSQDLGPGPGTWCLLLMADAVSVHDSSGHRGHAGQC